jgi:hypothetical protein
MSSTVDEIDTNLQAAIDSLRVSSKNEHISVELITTAAPVFFRQIFDTFV